MTYVVGLTGGIGCGKSTIEKMFKDLGAGIIDCDVISHELQQPGKAGFVYIRQLFGEAFTGFDGKLDRVRLRNLVFNNKEAKAKLEGLMSPLIYHVVTERIQQMKDLHPYLLVTVPLLLESKTFSNIIDRILVVDCPEHVQIERVMKRNGMSEAEVEKILCTQVPRWTRMVKADDIIRNFDCDPQDHAIVVKELHELYCLLSSQKNAAKQSNS
jgi:dephospho-CoA kinase